MAISGIYKITSTLKPERVYIGSSIDIPKRWKDHLRRLRKGDHNFKLQNHFNKYGEEDLIFSIIEEFQFISLDHLLSREDVYLNSLPYFNILLIAGSPLGYSRTIENCDNISKSLMGRTLSQEHCDNLSKIGRASCRERV